MWGTQSISSRGLDCVELRAFEVLQRNSVPWLGFTLLNVPMYNLVLLCIVYSCYVYSSLGIYILVSVLGNGPASRGLFHSTWVVMQTSGSSGKHLGRQQHIWVSEQRTDGRSVGRTDGEFLGFRKVKPYFKKLNPKCFRV